MCRRSRIKKGLDEALIGPKQIKVMNNGRTESGTRRPNCPAQRRLAAVIIKWSHKLGHMTYTGLVGELL